MLNYNLEGWRLGAMSTTNDVGSSDTGLEGSSPSAILLPYISRHFAGGVA